jgi:protein-S-isoprenylcysteine O-methyltransferase
MQFDNPWAVVAALWLVLVVIWFVGALATKRAVRRQSFWTRAVQFVLLAVAYEMAFNRRLAVGWLGWRFVKQAPVVAWAGVALTAAGVAVAVWARFILGRNWSGTVTVKEEHTLVQNGPYRFVRHPIYSGFTLAMLGTAVALGEVRGLVALAATLVAWRLKWPIEERFMIDQFGARYEAYRQRVSALIPGIW